MLSEPEFRVPGLCSHGDSRNSCTILPHAQVGTWQQHVWRDVAGPGMSSHTHAHAHAHAHTYTYTHTQQSMIFPSMSLG
eukprot:2424759-Rhodomonas_salina.1